MWRPARPADDDAIVGLSAALNAEDPGEAPVPEAHTRRTLAALRAEPVRGRAVILEVDGQVAGYALLISFWSNELGGELCNLDEIYVHAAQRGRGHATRLIEALAAGGEPWPTPPRALVLEVAPDNARTRRLYERAGFAPLRNLTMVRRLVPPG